LAQLFDQGDSLAEVVVRNFNHHHLISPHPSTSAERKRIPYQLAHFKGGSQGMRQKLDMTAGTLATDIINGRQ